MAETVEKLIITLADTVTSGFALLTKGQTILNCFPDWGVRVDYTINEWRAQPDVYFASGPDRVVVDRSVGDGEMVVIVYVREFDPAKTKVQQVPWAIAPGLTTADVPVDPVSQAASFATIGGVTNGSDKISRALTSVRFLADDTLRLERGSSFSPPPSGHVYVVTSLDGSFSVQTASYLDPNLAVPVDMAKSCVFVSHAADGGSDFGQRPNREPRAYLASASVVDWIIDIGGTRPWHAFILTFAAGNNGTVQRGTMTFVGGIATDPAVLAPEVDLLRATVHSPAYQFGAQSSSADGTQQSRAHATLDLQGSTALEGEMGTTIAVTATYAWEVVEWPEASADDSLFIAMLAGAI